MTLTALMTVGYEGASIETFLSTLLDAGISSLLDIREIASSRRFGFAKTALCNNLQSVAITYRHEPRLGSPRDIRTRLRECGDYANFFREFNGYLATQNTLVMHLANELAGSVVLLCYERDYNECHRKSVASAFAGITGLKPTHLRVPSMMPAQ